MSKSAAQLKALLETRRDAIYTELGAMTSTSVGGRPNASGPGLNLQEREHRKSLYEELADIDKQLSRLGVTVVESQEY